MKNYIKVDSLMGSKGVYTYQLPELQCFYNTQ